MFEHAKSQISLIDAHIESKRVRESFTIPVVVLMLIGFN